MRNANQPASQPREPMTVLEPDHVLARRALHDPAAFADLYHRYLTPIYGYCFRRLGSREAAEDATSLVFTKALEGLPKLQSQNVRAWLFAIAHNVVVDGYRTNRGVSDSQLLETIEHPDRVEEQTLKALDLEALTGALSVLTSDQRRVVELRLAGLTGPEIREVLGRSRSWVDTTQFRAVQRLRSVLLPPEERS